MRNNLLRLFSIAMAVALWYFVNSDNNLSLVGFSAPIEIKDLPADRVLTGQTHRQAQVTVKGPAFLISKLSSSPPVVRIRLPKDVDNRYVAPLPRSELDLPPSVQIVSIEPGEVKFTFDKLVKKRVPVVVPRIGTLGESFIVRDVEISPSEVELAGPEGELSSITSIETYPLDLRTAKEDFKRTLNIRLPGPHIQADEGQVKVAVDIDLVLMDRRFAAIPVQLEGGESVSLLKSQPATVVVTVSGPRELIKTLQPANVRALAKLQSDSEGKMVPIDIDVPTGVTLEQVEPLQVKVVRPAPVAETVKKKK